MHEISKKELKLALSNLNSFKERKNINTSIKTSKSTNQNNSFKLKNNNKTYINLIDDSSSIIRKSEKDPTNSKKNKKRKKMINRNINVNLKIFFQNNNNKFQCINEDKFFQDEYNSIYKLFINQKRNESNEKYSDFKKQNNSQKTQIIMKKVRFHDFINRKIELNKTKIVEKLKKSKKGNKKENNKLNYYLPVQGIFYEKNNNNNNSNNLNIKYKKSNMFIVDPPNINENKTKKMDNQSVIKRNEINSSLPLISSNDLKNKTQRMLFNKNSLNIKNFFSNDEINIKINSKKIRNLCNIHGYKKLINYNVISTPGSDYGKSKLEGEKLFFDYGKKNKSKVLVYRFPNLFGKWCKPNYNSVVATFCNNIANDLDIQVNDPNAELELAYIDDVVKELIDALEGNEHHCEYDGLNVIENPKGKYCYIPVTHKVTLGRIVELLNIFKDQTNTLVMPSIPNNSFEKKLYSTYLSYLPKEKVKFELKMNVDDRGSFTELLKTKDCGQFSVNISKPGITKGQHWHHSKWEFFMVVSGHALIQERKVGTDEIIEFEVSGEKIEAVHMLPGYTHNIINLSETENLITVMWANEMFDSNHPDTFGESV